MTADIETAEASWPQEPLVAALRDQRFDAFTEISPFAACLMPLLTAVGWRGAFRQVADALPHAADTGFDLADLRNTLACLGYDTSPRRTTSDGLDPRLLPCLFVPADGGPQVIVRRRGDDLLVFDGLDNRMEWVAAARAGGTAYLVSRADDGREAGTTEHEPGSGTWSHAFRRRFRAMAVPLLALGIALAVLVPGTALLGMALVDRIARPGGLTIAALAAAVAGVLAAELAVRLIRAGMLARLAGRVDYLVSTTAMDRILSLSPSLVEPAPLGIQLRRLGEFDAVRRATAGPLLPAAGDLPAAAACLVLAGIVFDAALYGVAAGALSLLVFMRLRWTVDRRAQTGLRQAARSRYAFVLEAVGALKPIKSNGADEVWQERHREQTATASIAARAAMRRNAAFATLGTAIVVLALLAVLALVTGAWSTGGLTTGEGVAVLWLAARGLMPLQAVNANLGDLVEARAALAGLDRLMQLPLEKRRVPSQSPQRSWRGALHCDRLQFRYAGDAPPALSGVTVTIEPGEMMAVLGATGAGKSTLLRLVGGIHVPQSGWISIDGVDLQQLDPVTLRQTVSYLPQSVRLFPGTIAQNLRLADPTASDERLVYACAEAGVLHDILALPDGFDTWLGDAHRGRLPGGLLRKLAVARALVREAPVLLLDEPAVDLDPPADEALIERLRALRGRSTVIMVTQRPSHARLADRALVLERGRLRFLGLPEQALSVLQE